MIEFHPNKRATWQPVLYGLLAGLAGFAIGCGWDAGWHAPVWWADGACLGGVLFLVAWWPCMLAWDRTLRKTYEPTPPVPPEEPEVLPEEIEYIVACREGSTTHHLYNLPCSPSDLQHIGMRYVEKVPLTYQNWLGYFKETEFGKIIMWMHGCHWLTYNGPRKAVTMLPFGEDILNDLAVNGIQEALPHPNRPGVPIYRPTDRYDNTIQ